MSRFINGIKSFVHSISTNDHYAAYDPSRPLGQEDAAPLTAAGGDRRASSSSTGSAGGAGYVPGLRSQQLGGAGIPLNDFARDGPPIPSPALSWTRIDSWIEQNYPELFDQILGGATANDLNDLEHDIECSLPADVRESFEVHDGQEKGGKPTGVFYGITLLDLEGVSEEWNVWRQAALRLESLQQRRSQHASQHASKPSSSAAPPAARRADGSAWLDHQQSCPPDHVQPLYAHPGWVPLAKDFDGNNIGVDLAPAPSGRYGQVILFGRDFDVKYVVAPSWGDFLAQFAADLESGSCYIDEDVEDAVFAFKAPDGRLVSYFNVLRQRVERTLPPRTAAPRRSVMTATVSNAPVNSGRTTPRLVSPLGSSTSLHRTGDARPDKPDARAASKLAKGLNEIDLSEDAPRREPLSIRTPQRSVEPEAEPASGKAAKEVTELKELKGSKEPTESEPQEPTKSEPKESTKSEPKESTKSQSKESKEPKEPEATPEPKASSEPKNVKTPKNGKAAKNAKGPKSAEPKDAEPKKAEDQPAEDREPDTASAEIA